MGWMPSPPDPNPGMIASAQASQAVAEEQLGLSREQFEYAKQQDAQNWQRIQPLLNQQMRISDAQEARAQDYYNYETNTFRPLEQSVVDDANKFDTESERERQAGLAESDVEQQFAAARGSAQRNLERYGINPNSEKFASLNNDLATNEGLARAGAANDARFKARQMGFAMKMDAAGLGRNLAPNATAAAETALQGSNSAVGNTLATSQTGFNERQGAIGDYGSVQAGLGNAAGIYGQDFNARMSGYNANMSALGGLFGGVGSFLGYGLGSGWMMKKDGGSIHGPGTSTSDSIPAMLSDGEYVVPAPVVRQLGIKFFDNLIAKHGSSENRAAMEQRQGIQRPGVKKFADGGAVGTIGSEGGEYTPTPDQATLYVPTPQQYQGGVPNDTATMDSGSLPGSNPAQRAAQTMQMMMMGRANAPVDPWAASRDAYAQHLALANGSMPDNPAGRMAHNPNDPVFYGMPGHGVQYANDADEMAHIYNNSGPSALLATHQSAGFNTKPYGLKGPGPMGAMIAQRNAMAEIAAHRASMATMNPAARGNYYGGYNPASRYPQPTMGLRRKYAVTRPFGSTAALFKNGGPVETRKH